MIRFPLHTSHDSAIVRALQAAAPELTIGDAPFWTDAALLSDAGIPSVVFGPGGGGIHETSEWLDLGSFEQFAAFCGPPPAISAAEPAVGNGSSPVVDDRRRFRAPES